MENVWCYPPSCVIHTNSEYFVRCIARSPRECRNLSMRIQCSAGVVMTDPVEKAFQGTSHTISRKELEEWGNSPFTPLQTHAILEALEAGKQPSMAAWMWIICNLSCESAARTRLQLIADYKEMKRRKSEEAKCGPNPMATANGAERVQEAVTSKRYLTGSAGGRRLLSARRRASFHRQPSPSTTGSRALETPYMSWLGKSAGPDASAAPSPAMVTRRVLDTLEAASSPMPAPRVSCHRKRGPVEAEWTQK